MPTPRVDKSDPFGLFQRMLFYVSVFSVAFYLFHVQAVATTYTSELPNHIKLATNVVAPNLFGFAVPHPGFHWMILAIAKITPLSLQSASIFLLSIFVVIIARMILRVLDGLIGGTYTASQQIWIGASLLVTSAIYFPPVSQNFYLGQGTPNFWAVPTLIVVKPFALGSLSLFLLAMNSTDQKRSIRYLAALAFVLLMSVIMKPSFIVGFAPTVAVWLVLKRKRLEIVVWFQLGLAFLPSVLLLAFQYYQNYFSSKSAIILTWFGVWKLYSHHIFMSILLGIAFPLSVTLCRFREMEKNQNIQFAWLFYGVTILQFAFLAEEKYFVAGNFGWGYVIAQWFLFIFATAEFFRWLGEAMRTNFGERLKIGTVSVLFSLHLTSGAAYLVKQLGGGSYE